MELFVVGCHGGETPRHRTCAFVIDKHIAIDAGSLTSGLELDDQYRLTSCIVSHAHLDHIRDLATIADNRAQKNCPPLEVIGTKFTLGVLRTHFFNNKLWPDFTRIPSLKNPTLRFREIEPEKPIMVSGVRITAVKVHHTIETVALIFERNGKTIAYSGDTGPTTRLWEVLNDLDDLSALLMEVSFPNEEAKLAKASGHHTPATLEVELRKLSASKSKNVLLYHIKPAFQKEVEQQCLRIKGHDLTITRLGDRYLI
ncbi:MAG: 3',5'-cyclic-nucleotide phosphodiesterase [Polyangiaceae bacterium]|nr:3',5'-cyclic-nucleotide phosphodiesterase [Polyangiaceae bacterium]